MEVKGVLIAISVFIQCPLREAVTVAWRAFGRGYEVQETGGGYTENPVGHEAGRGLDGTGSPDETELDEGRQREDDVFRVAEVDGAGEFVAGRPEPVVELIPQQGVKDGEFPVRQDEAGPV